MKYYENILESKEFNDLNGSNCLVCVNYYNLRKPTEHESSFVGYFMGINHSPFTKPAFSFQEYGSKKEINLYRECLKSYFFLRKYETLAEAIADYDYHGSPYLINPTFVMRITYDYTKKCFSLADQAGANQDLPVQHSREMLQSGPWWSYSKPMLPFHLFKDEIKKEIDKLEEDQIPSFVEKLNKKLKEYL